MPKLMNKKNEKSLYLKSYFVDYYIVVSSPKRYITFEQIFLKSLKWIGQFLHS